MFELVNNIELTENEHVMKCVMSSLSVAKEEILSVTATMLNKLTFALVILSKNQHNTYFNHYIFESIALLVLNMFSFGPHHTEKF